MNFRERRDRAIALLHRKGIPLHLSEPMYLRLFRRTGLEIRPLHFESFWRTTLIGAAWFAPWWGVVMWFFRWRDVGLDPGHAVVASAICGLCFGLVMACFYAYSRRKHHLPAWESLG
jgi:membrane associated rhomboid family serine protease